MKKFVGAMMMFVMMVIMVSAVIAEPADNWDDANKILRKYAEENQMYWWIEKHYDAETETRFALLTADNDYLLDMYGIDFKNSAVAEFENWYKGMYDASFPEAHAQVKVAPVDIVNDTMVYELLVTADIDMEPDNAEVVKNGRALFVVY